jgi:DNA gyrase subunit A
MKIKAYEIEKKSRKSVGVSAAVYAPLSEGEMVRQIMIAPEPEKKNLVLITRLGFIKKTPVDSFLNMRSNGLKIISLVEDDEVVAVEAMEKDGLILVVASSGKASTFESSEVRVTGRSSRGVRVMKLKSGDFIINGFSIEPDQCVLTVSEYGIGKRTSLDQFSVHHKGTSGVLAFKESERTGKLVKSLPVKDTDEIIIATSNEKTIRIKVSEIKIQSRFTSGVRLIDADPENKVIEVTKFDPKVDDSEGPVDEE